MKNFLVGCPNLNPQDFQTKEEKQKNKIPHQTITNSEMYFKVKAEPDMPNTTVRFQYSLKDFNSQIITLKIKEKDQWKNLALINHPLLNNLDWNSVSDSSLRLYQRKDTYNSISNFLEKNQKFQLQTSADQAALPHVVNAKINPKKLEDLKSLNEIDFILTSYEPSFIDGMWRWYTQRFDLNQFNLPDQELEFAISLSNPESLPNDPLLLSVVSIDHYLRGE